VNENIIKKIDNFSLNIRRNILEMAYVAGASSSHLGGALSIVEIISTLFTTQINIDNKNPNWVNKDRFILSKGHACLAYYSALSEVGFITKKELKTFEKDGSNLLGHPVLNKKMGIDFSNGSLGMGLSLGIGVAISLKKKKKNFNVYVVMGDGECNEGSVWEGALSAPNLELNNLNVIVDNNGFQQTGSNKNIMNLLDLKKKWESFGWHVEEVDGHNINNLNKIFLSIKKINKPKVIIAKTIKGKGFSFSENNNEWHHKVLSKSMYDQAINELSSND
jgi:transketolase